MMVICNFVGNTERMRSEKYNQANNGRVRA